MKSLLHLLLQIIPTKTAYAHCDIPCGIYTPEQAKTAAKTVVVMVTKINALPIQEDRTPDDQANFIRMVETKEEHAQICKQELLILWTDYFKPEHLKMFPDLHTTFWEAAKLCSQNKQHIDSQLANQLVTAVDKISEMFYETLGHSS